MTALGKILVFVNLAFSLLTCGLIVMVFATRTNWKAGYDRVDKAAKAADAFYQAELDLGRKAVEAEKTETKRVAAELDTARKEIAQKTQSLESTSKDLAKALETIGTGQGNVTAVGEEMKRLKQEREDLVKEREGLRGQVVTLTTEMNDQRSKKVDAEGKVRLLTERNGRLLEQVSELNRAIALAKSSGAPGASPGSASATTAAKPTGPAQTVRGQVISTDAATGLTTISVGSDAGVSTGDVMQVYRLDADPKKSLYLGEITIRATRNKEAVGQFAAKTKQGLKPGDEVSSNILGDGR